MISQTIQLSQKKSPDYIADDNLTFTKSAAHPVQTENMPPANDSIRPFADSPSDTDYQIASEAVLQEDDMKRDLGLRVIAALNEWRTKYHLESLPDKIVLTQVMNILLVLKNTL